MCNKAFNFDVVSGGEGFGGSFGYTQDGFIENFADEYSPDVLVGGFHYSYSECPSEDIVRILLTKDDRSVRSNDFNLVTQSSYSLKIEASTTTLGNLDLHLKDIDPSKWLKISRKYSTIFNKFNPEFGEVIKDGFSRIFEDAYPRPVKKTKE